jgi:hypothetical protein
MTYVKELSQKYSGMTGENYEELQDILSSGHDSNLGPPEYISARR